LDDLADPEADPSRAAALVRDAVRSIKEANSTLSEATPDADLLKRLQHEVEEGRAQADRLVESAAVGLAARGLTHELRTHLGEIRQRVTRLERGAGGASAKPHLVAIRRSCAALQQAASLVDPLMQRSRAVKDTFGLREFVKTYLGQREATLQRWGATAMVQGPEIRVRMNRARLLQVIDNLVRNSLFWMRRSTPEGKRRITVQTTPSGLVLEDTGPGIDPRVEESLFELFVTAKHQEEDGQGLGLFIVNQLLALDGCSVVLLPIRNEWERRFRFLIDLSAVMTRI
jgi:signal transduction histidine kinase